MKYGQTSLYILLSLVFGTIVFLTTLSLAYAQTGDETRPADEAIGNTKTERVKEESNVRTLLERTKETVRVNAERIKEEAKKLESERKVEKEEATTSDEPRSLLEKARNVLMQKKAELRGKEDESTDEDKTEDQSVRKEAQKERGAGKLEVKLKERANTYLADVTKKMDAAINRLETLTGRIESRIAKLESLGIDLTKARELLTEAKAKTLEAEGQIKIALEEARIALESDTPKESFGKVVSTLAQAKENLRNAHQSLIEVVRMIKSGTEKEGDEKKSESGN